MPNLDSVASPFFHHESGMQTKEKMKREMYRFTTKQLTTRYLQQYM